MLIVAIVMRLGIYGVVLRIIVGWIKGVMLLVFFVVAVRVIDVLHRVLFAKSAQFQNTAISNNAPWVELAIYHWVYIVQGP